MTTATLGGRYQVVIPKRERTLLDLAPHTKVNVEIEDDHLVVRPLTSRTSRGIGAELRGEGESVDYVRELRAEWGKRS